MSKDEYTKNKSTQPFDKLFMIKKTKISKFKSIFLAKIIVNLDLAFNIPQYIAHYATDEDWINLSKLIYESYVHNGLSPHESTGISIEKSKIQNYNVINLEINLPGSAVMLECKNKPVFQRLNFWSCSEGIIYPRYAHFCSLVVIDDKNKNRTKMNWTESTVLTRSIHYVTTSLIF